MDGDTPLPASPREVTVVVRDGGHVSAQRDDGTRSGGQQLQLDTVDEQLVRTFSRWLAVRERQWAREDVAAFGSLLFRVLLAGGVWNLIAVTLNDLLPGQSVRLRLSFATSAGVQKTAAFPWEYLYRPDSVEQPGRFLAMDDRLLLSRSISGPGVAPASGDAGPLRVLVVVSQPTDEIDVVPEPLLEVFDELAGKGSFEILHLHEATTRALHDALRDRPPDILHILGHGRQDGTTGHGQIAFVGIDELADWITGEQLSAIAGEGTPRLVLLQSCSAGREDPSLSFAGVAPQMVRHGFPSVVAMQYDVAPDVATTFARTFYAEILKSGQIDAATQRARSFLAGPTSGYGDPRLIGLPVVYARRGSGALSALAGMGRGRKQSDER